MLEEAPDRAASGGAARLRGTIELVVVGALALASLWIARSTDGIQATWLALGAVLLGPAFRRALVLRGRVAPGPAWAFAVEVAGLALALRPSLVPWATLVAGGAALAGPLVDATPPSPRVARLEGARPLERLAPLALAVLAFGWAETHVPAHRREETVAFGAALALLAALAHAPGAARTPAATARRMAAFAIFLAEAFLLGYQEREGVPLRAEAVTRGLAVLAVGLELASLARERAPAPAAPLALRRGARGAFGVAVLGLGLALGLGPLLAAERRLDLASLPESRREGLARMAQLPAALDTGLETPGPVRLFVDGEPLGLEEARGQGVAASGSGTFAVAGDRVVWSSREAADPAQDGHRYELAYRPALHRSRPARVAFELALALLVFAWSVGAIDLESPSSPRERALAPLLLAVCVAATLPGRWDRLHLVPDSGGYIRHVAMRTPLYPAFVDLVDARPQESKDDPSHDALEWSSVARPRPGHRFLGVARVQKLVALASLTLLLWTLGDSVNAWLLVAIASVATLVDAATGNDAAITFNLETLQSEGLNHSLVFLYVAATFAYVRRPGWLRGLALAALVALLLLDRPANAPFVAAFALVWVLHAQLDGAWRATARTAALGLATVVPLLLVCASTYRATGYFRLHAFSGSNIFCTAFSLATPEDVDAFPEPDLHELVRRCVLEPPRPRVPAEGDEYVNVNLYEIGIPVLEDLHVLPPPPRHLFVRDDMLGAVGKRLVWRHPIAFARLALGQVGRVLSWPVHGPLAAFFVAGAWLAWRRRRPLDLLVAFLAALPLLAILPACAFNVPIPRYRSQLAFLELTAVPLLLLLLVSHPRAAKLPGDPA